MEINKSVKCLLINPKDLYSEAQGYVCKKRGVAACTCNHNAQVNIWKKEGF